VIEHLGIDGLVGKKLRTLLPIHKSPSDTSYSPKILSVERLRNHFHGYNRHCRISEGNPSYYPLH
jgi:hypothetical protein